MQDFRAVRDLDNPARLALQDSRDSPGLPVILDLSDCLVEMVLPELLACLVCNIVHASIYVNNNLI